MDTSSPTCQIYLQSLDSQMNKLPQIRQKNFLLKTFNPTLSRAKKQLVKQESKAEMLRPRRRQSSLKLVHEVSKELANAVDISPNKNILRGMQSEKFDET